MLYNYLCNIVLLLNTFTNIFIHTVNGHNTITIMFDEHNTLMCAKYIVDYGGVRRTPEKCVVDQYLYAT